MEFITALQQRLSAELPGRACHMEFYPVRFKEEDFADVDTYRRAAVGIHFFPAPTGWDFLLIERSEYDGQHSKQMAFPGGKIEESDTDTVLTARRETFEEVGIPMENGVHIGTLTEVYIPVSRFRVMPHLFVHSSLPDLVLDEREVNSVELCAVSDLLLPQTQSEQERDLGVSGIRKKVPCFILNQKVVWGATALMLAELKILIQDLQMH